MFGRGFYLKVVKFLLLALVYLVFVYLYTLLAHLTHADKLQQNKVEKVQDIIDKSDSDRVDNSDFAVDEDPVRDEFKGIESKIEAFDKLGDPFQGAEKEEIADNDIENEAINKIEELIENKEEEVANIEEDNQYDKWVEEWVWMRELNIIT